MAGCLALCEHRPATAQNGETCCTKCGTVLGMDVADTAKGSNANLFLQLQTGSMPPEITKTKINTKKTWLSEFSNACEKLNLPQNACMHAWKMFRTFG